MISTTVEIVDGVKLIHAKDIDLGYVSIYVVVDVGSLHDPIGKDGLAVLTVASMCRGTKSRSYQQITDETSDMGASLLYTATVQYACIYGEVISRYVHQWGEIVADVLAHPVFAAKEVARERSLALEQLRSLRDEDEKLAAYFYEQFLFPGHPISRLTVGNLNTVSHLTAADCKQFHEAHFRKENMFVVVAGSIDEDGAKQLVQKLTCDIPDGRTLRPAQEVPKPAKKRRILLVDKPDRTQSYVVMGHLSLDIFDSDLYGMIVGNAAFGGSDTARLFHEIRDVRGWSYFAHSTLYAGPEFGTVRIEFAPPTDKTVQAIELVLHMMQQVAQNGLTDEEIEFFKAHLANEFPLSIETVSDLAWRKFSCEIDSLPFEYCERYPENIKAVDNQTVNKALARWFKPQEATIVVVCSAFEIEHELRATFPDDEITIIPYTTIELTR